LPSGVLEVQSCTDSETQLTLNLDKDTYRVRVTSHRLYTVVGDVGEDFYEVEIWKERFAKPKILREYKPKKAEE
jgi:hypothetical protein